MKTIKKTTLLITLLCLYYTASAQQNLVPNGSFEDTIANPLGGTIGDAVGWTSCNLSPDYYNPAFDGDGFGFGTPNCFYTGYQIPIYGNSFAGLGLTAIPEQPAEFIAVQLTQPMVVGTKYYVSAHISKADQYPCATNNFCFRFYNSLYKSPSTPPILDNFAHVRSTAIISDTLNWNLVGGSFIADSAYQYLIIGNFFNLNQTERLHCMSADASYYYIDNVCVSSDSIICLIPTSIPNSDLQINELKVYPNPACDLLSINNFGQTKKYSLYNFTGEVCRTGQLIKGENLIDVNTLSGGLYILLTEKSVYKILINNH